MTQIIWDILRARYPELPEDPARLIEPGLEVVIDGTERGVLLTMRGDTATVMTADGVIDCSGEYITATGEKMPIREAVRAYLNATSDTPGLIDRATGKTYRSVKEFCKDTGLGKSSAYRMLSGERKTVEGHQLESV